VIFDVMAIDKVHQILNDFYIRRFNAVLWPLFMYFSMYLLTMIHNFGFGSA